MNASSCRGRSLFLILPNVLSKGHLNDVQIRINKMVSKTEVWDISVLLAGKKLNVMKRNGRTDGRSDVLITGTDVSRPSAHYDPIPSLPHFRDEMWMPERNFYHRDIFSISTTSR